MGSLVSFFSKGSYMLQSASLDPSWNPVIIEIVVFLIIIMRLGSFDWLVRFSSVLTVASLGSA
jgi:hypothetical protein